MILNIPYKFLIMIIAIAWLAHILLSIPPKSVSVSQWELVKKLLVAQANRLVYLLFYLLAAWIGNNIIFFNHSLYFVVWVVRILTAYTAIKQTIFFVIGIFSIRERGDGRVTLSNLILSSVFALAALSI